MGTRGQEETHDKCNSAIPVLVASRAQGAVTLPSIIASSGHGSEISTQDIYSIYSGYLQYLHRALGGLMHLPRIINWQKSGWMDQCQVQGGAIGFH